MTTPTASVLMAQRTHPLRIREFPAHETPEARLADLGAGALSDAELLSLILRVDTLDQCWQLLRTFDGFAGLQRASLADLQRAPGMTRIRAASLKAALELGRRLALQQGEERFQIKSPTDVAQLLQVEMAHLDQEQLRVICLDTKNRVQKIQTVYVGSVNSSLVRVAEIFKEPIRLNSTAIIVCHNHPSGDPTASPEDVLVTRAIVDAGKLLDIEVLDHLIIGQGRYISMRERRLGFNT